MRPLFDWLFYGHVWIALAAAALSWLSVRSAVGPAWLAGERWIHLFTYAATFGVYTLHRYLSFRRAGVEPRARRYALVRRYPRLSLLLGVISLFVASGIAAAGLDVIGPILLLAVPVTAFYLTPPWPGARRLRDFPYLKSLWVGLAWALVTSTVPILIAEVYQNPPGPVPIGAYVTDGLTRFVFTLQIALLFDLRDVDLDRAQGVRTVANRLPRLLGRLTIILPLICFTLAASQRAPFLIAVSYLLVWPVGYLTLQRRSEDWFAVVVNGVLFAPAVAYGLFG